MEIYRTDVVDLGGVHCSTVTILSASEFDEETRDIVAALKYHGQKSLARGLALRCCHAMSLHDDCDLLTWIPTLDSRRHRRGFDHAELIARHTGAHLGKSAQRLLRRTTNGHQTGRSRLDRLSGVGFVAHPGVRGHSVWVIDDVCTTGATLTAAAHALDRAGATKVQCVAAAGVAEKSLTEWQTTSRERGTTHRTQDLG